MANRKDISGQWFGRLFALKPVGSSKLGVSWLCLCVCGRGSLATTASLRYGGKKSCGCLRREVSSKAGRMNARRNGLRYGCSTAEPYVYGLELEDSLPVDFIKPKQIDWAEHF